MDKPLAEIEMLRNAFSYDGVLANAGSVVISYLDAISDDAHVVVWPVELTRERLEFLADTWNSTYGVGGAIQALRALAAIAPVRKKRVVNLWISPGGGQVWKDIGETFDSWPSTDGWRCVARNVELED